MGANRLGPITTTGYALAALLFGHRFYLAAAQEAFSLRLGLIGPLGRRLWNDSNRRTPFIHSYVSTSTEDLWIERQFRVADLATLDGRRAAAYDMLREFFDYFDWDFTEEQFNSYVEVDLRRFVALE